MEVKITLTIKGVEQEFKADVKTDQDITDILWEVRRELRAGIRKEVR